MLIKIENDPHRTVGIMSSCTCDQWAKHQFDRTELNGTLQMQRECKKETELNSSVIF